MSLSRRRQQGITLIEVLASLAVIAAMTVGVTRLIDAYTQDTQIAVTAQHVSAVGSAAEAYIKDNYAAVQAVATPTTPALVTVPMLIATGYLTNGFSTTNNKRQATCVLVLEPTANMLNALVVTEGGTTIDDISLGGLAGLVGANGGGIYSSAATTLRGTMGAWSTAIGNYANANASALKCDGTAGTPALAAGHPIMALWFADGDVSSGFLHRDSVPGHPELNTMNTPLIMASIQTEATACTTTGAIARDATGLLLSCQAATWQKQAGGAGYWKDPVANVASLPVCNAAAAWQTRVVQTPTVGVGPRAYTCNGASWQPLSIDDSGNLLVAGRLTAVNETITGTATINALNGNLQITATAAVGTACVGEGRIATSTTNSGMIVSCQSAVWKATSWNPATASTRIVTNSCSDEWGGCVTSATCAADEAMTGCSASGASNWYISGKSCVASWHMSGSNVRAYGTCSK